jgi:hypothetical protein
MPLVTTFFVTLTNCDLNMHNQIPYTPLQVCDYKPKKKKKKPLQNKCFMVE